MGKKLSACLVLLMSVSAVAVGEKDLQVLADTIDGVRPRDMMNRYLLGQIEQAWQRWQADYENRKTPEQIAAYQKLMREKFLEAIGPFPERTPLNAKVTGVVNRKGYRVEKVIFESMPGFYVTAACFLPDPELHKPPYPGVLVPCGHSHNGKAHDTYQTMGALLALNGMAALVFDPIDQGERIQLLDKAGREMMWGTHGHTMAGIGAMLVGRNTAWYEIWDGMRSIDYLQSRPEVDGDRIGCTGNSGGGTQTSYLMALDERIKAAAPSCFLNRQGRQIDNSPGDAEQNIFGQLAFGMDHADYIMMRAPRPVLILAATHDFFDIQATWVSFRHAKRLYTRMGFAERVDLLENDAKHNYDKLPREGAVRWMSRWLLKRDKEIQEPRIEIMTDEQLRCAPRGQVMLMPGARSVYDLDAQRETRLAESRKKLWADTPSSELRDRIRRIAGIRKLAELPEPKVRQAGAVKHGGWAVEKLIIIPEPGIFLPSLRFAPAQPPTGPAVLYLHETDLAADAAAGGPIEKLLRAGKTVLAVSLRGTGQTQQTAQGKFGGDLGRDWADVYKAYLLGRSYVGMRSEDVLVCARHAAATAGSKQVELVAVGNVGVPALHAAALEPQLFDSVRLSRTLTSWSSVARARQTQNQLVNAVHGALETYDLPDLAGMLSGKLTLDQPVDPLARPIQASTPPPRRPSDDRRLEAVVAFADNVLTKGRDRWSGKDTPLFADGVNVDTGEPVEWVFQGQRWIVSNLASQQDLFRTLTGLSRLTGEPRYRASAEAATRYHLDHLRHNSGLLFWGGHRFIDLRALKVVGEQNSHEFKCSYPYYDLLWELDPKAAERFIKAFWNAHVLDWSNLDMNRHGIYDRPMGELWASRFVGAKPFFEGKGLTFINCGSDLVYAAGLLYAYTGDAAALAWSKRLAEQYVRARDPATGLGAYQFSQVTSGDRAKRQLGPEFGELALEGRVLDPGRATVIYGRVAISQLRLAERLGKDGTEFLQWARSGLAAYARKAYDPRSNMLTAMFTDGTKLTPEAVKRPGYYSAESFRPEPAGTMLFLSYALGYRLTGDELLWQTAGSIAKAHGLGDLGTAPGQAVQVNLATACNDPLGLLGLLEIMRISRNGAYLELARRIGDNIVAKCFHKGFFVPSDKHVNACFDALEPLALLALEAHLRGTPDEVPAYPGGRGYIHGPHDGMGRTYDARAIWAKTRKPASAGARDERKQAPVSVWNVDENRIRPRHGYLARAPAAVRSVSVSDRPG